MIQTKLTHNTINWNKINSYKEVTKILYPDGFNKKEQHGLWKLKIKVSKEEWNKIKHLFQFYSKKEEQIKNMKYYGWATTQPVEVMKILYALRHNN